MEIENNHNKSEYLNNTCIVLLIINKLGKLGVSSVESILRNSNCAIIIGYTNEIDVIKFRSHTRITLLKLREISEYTDGKPSDFTNPAFYKIVAKKWELFEKVLQMNFEYVIYSDTDVFWLTDPLPSLINSFIKNVDWQLQIQSDTRRLDFLVPCMGFLAMRNTPTMRKIIEECKSIHQNNIENSLMMIGDDEVMREYVHNCHDLKWYRELPQSTFPIGAFLNLYNTNTLFRGIPRVKPYIFHANYTVGELKKNLLLATFVRQYPELKKISSIYLKLQIINNVILKKIQCLLRHGKKR